MKEMDKLEKFIHDNKSAFDTEEPKGNLWENIEDQLQPSIKIIPGKRNINFWQVAAVVLLLVSASLVVERFAFRDEVINQQAAEIYNDEFNEAEGFYLSLVSERKKIIEEQLKDDPAAKEEFLSEVEDLDKKYEQLKDEIKYGNQEEILDAMILNLQMRIEVLNQQIEIIEKYKQQEKGQEDVTI